jgi:hypothetical protein
MSPYLEIALIVLIGMAITFFLGEWIVRRRSGRAPDDTSTIG